MPFLFPIAKDELLTAEFGSSEGNEEFEL